MSRGAESTTEYAGVVIANGHNWNPKMPQYPGQESFGGEIIHSADYKGADILRGRRVLVVGAGNTGCDVAVDSAQNAAAHLALDQARLLLQPEVRHGPARVTRPPTCCSRCASRWRVRRQAFKTTLKLTVGDFAKFGLKKPDHEFFETHPIVNQQLVYYVGHGDITPVDDIDHFDADGVVFTDGRRADVDLVVFCTGYLVTFPFLADAEEELNWQVDHPVLALQVFTPRHRNLFVSGLHPARQRPVDARPLAGHDDRPLHRGRADASRRRRPVLPHGDRGGGPHVHRRHDLQGLEPPLLRGRPPGVPAGAAVRDPRAGGRAVSASSRKGRRTRVMRPWDWSLPPRPVSHREVISAQPAEPTGRPPLLMVHGIAHAAWCFGENWVPAAAEAGYPAYAVSLRGHGGSAGGRHLGRTTIRDYVHDVMQTITELPEPPVLIGHSMGAIVAQLVAERYPLRGLVLLTPAPLHSAVGDLMTIARDRPADLRPGDRGADPVHGARGALRGAGRRHRAGLLGSDRHRVAAGAVGAAPPAQHRPIRCPVLVVGTPEDRLVRDGRRAAHGEPARRRAHLVPRHGARPDAGRGLGSRAR